MKLEVLFLVLDQSGEISQSRKYLNFDIHDFGPRQSPRELRMVERSSSELFAAGRSVIVCLTPGNSVKPACCVLIQNTS